RDSHEFLQHVCLLWGGVCKRDLPVASGRPASCHANAGTALVFPLLNTVMPSLLRPETRGAVLSSQLRARAKDFMRGPTRESRKPSALVRRDARRMSLPKTR